MKSYKKILLAAAASLSLLAASAQADSRIPAV